MKSTLPLTFIILLLLLSCSTNQKQPPPSYAPEVVEAHGYVVPTDSVMTPKVVPAELTRASQAMKPKVIPIKSNIHQAGKPKVNSAGVPRVCTLGKDGFLVPEMVPSIGKRVVAGPPEIVIAGDAYTKDKNPQNFSSFGKLQGLINNNVYCMEEDKNGNLWIGAVGGGLSKYDGKSFTNFTMRQGLANVIISCVLEDYEGNLWIGTFGGVIKYDGKNFIHFTDKDGLSDNTVWALHQDKQGDIWIGTQDGGVNRFDGKSFSHFNQKSGFNAYPVRDICEDEKGILWFGTFGGGLTTYDRVSFRHFTKKEGLCSENILCLKVDKSGDLWIGTEGGGASKFDGKTFTTFTSKEGLSSDSVVSIMQDRTGALWFGTSEMGICKYEANTFAHFTRSEGLTSDFVTSMLEDKRGNLWFGTAEGGVNKFNGKLFTHYNKNEGLSGYSVQSILEDNSGNLWFGTQQSGAVKYDGRSFTHFTDKEGLDHNFVTCVLKGNKDSLWFGGFFAASVYDGKNFSHLREQGGDIWNMLQDSNGNVWLGTVMGGVIRYDGKTFTRYTDREGLSNNRVWSSFKDKSGRLWFGTEGGLNMYGGNRFTHYTKKQGLKDDYITSLLEDQSGNIWIGYMTGGVTRYDGSTFTHMTEREGLSSNQVTSIFEDKSGNIWLGTSNGISKLMKKNLAFLDEQASKRSGSNQLGVLFKNYTYEDGFVGIQVNLGKSIFETKDGSIWIGTADRLTVFHPGEETLDTIPPSIQLTGVALFSENIPWQSLLTGNSDSTGIYRPKDTNIVLGNGINVHDVYFDSVNKWYSIPQHLSLANDNNNIAFQFVGITTASPRKVKYQYKLEGQDDNWSALTGRSEATYGNLPHGNYTFRVKAMNGDGYWSNEYHYSFTIRPPWWHTWWAYTIFGLTFLGIIYAVFRYRLNKVRRDHEIKQKTAELEMQTLRAQMNPHFIFNSLNSINLFILENNKLQASEYLSKFSRLVRLILNNSSEAFIPLKQELEALQLYLELESLRFEQRFNYIITVDNNIDTSELKVPPLIIQPYAENAIWHGLMPKKEAGTLEISLCQQEEVLLCKIRDDGIGRKKAEENKSKSSSGNKSMGMRVTADRIAILQNQDQGNSYITINDLVLPDGSPGGTEVLLKIPVRL